MMFERKFNLFIFTDKYDIKLHMKFIYLPLSVTKTSIVFGKDKSEIEKTLNSMKGIKIIINTEKEDTLNNFVQGHYLPICTLENKWDSFEEYISHLRANYRRRYNIALKKGKDIKVGETVKLYVSIGTGLKEIAMPYVIGDTEEEAKKKSIEALKSVGLNEKYFQKSPFELSGGEKRRVAFAGMSSLNKNFSSYLTENASDGYWWTLSPAYFAYLNMMDHDIIQAQVLEVGDSILDGSSDETISVRPSIALISSVTISGGSGTSEDPYVVN